MPMDSSRLDKIVKLGYGSKLVIPVYGEYFGQNHNQTTLKKIYKKFGEDIIYFSLVPQDSYQKRMGWPEEPFTNVLPADALEVSKKNWLGYISPVEPREDDYVHEDRQIYINKLIQLSKKTPVLIKGRVIKEDSEYSVLLFASHKEIDSYLEKFC